MSAALGLGDPEQDPSTDQTPQPSSTTEASAVEPSDEPKSDGLNSASFTVPLTIELETLQVPLGRLQALREGAVLPLEASEGPILVKVIAGGKVIAHGTLVSVGPGYGVLIGEPGEES